MNIFSSDRSGICITWASGKSQPIFLATSMADVSRRIASHRLRQRARGTEGRCRGKYQPCWPKSKPVRLFALAFALTLLSSLSACTPSPASALPASAPTSSAAPAASSGTAAPLAGTPGATASQGQLRLASPLGPRLGSAVAVHGFYELQDIPRNQGSTAESCLILYTGAATRQQAPLCSTQNCPHSDETCTAWLPRPAYSYLLAEAAGQLLIINRGSDSFTGEATVAAPPAEEDRGAVYIAGADGVNRRLLCTLAAGHTASFFCATSDESLYLLVQSLPSTSVTTLADTLLNTDLLRVDLTTGQQQVLYSLDIRNASIDDVWQNQFILATAQRPQPDSAFDANAAGWEANLRAGVRRLSTIHPTTGEITPLPIELPDYGLGHMVFDDASLYYTWQDPSRDSRTTPPDPNLYRVDMASGTQEVFLSGQPGELLGIDELTGGNMLYSVIFEGNPPGSASLTPSISYHWAQLASRTTHDRTLTFTHDPLYEGGGEDTEEMVPIIAEFEDSYLVRVGYAPLAASGNYQDIRALITKEDFWAGKPSYIPIVQVTG